MTRVACIGECMVELTLPDDAAAARVGFAGDTLNTAVYLKRSAPALSVAGATGRLTMKLEPRPGWLSTCIRP